MINTCSFHLRLSPPGRTVYKRSHRLRTPHHQDFYYHSFILTYRASAVTIIHTSDHRPDRRRHLRLRQKQTEVWRRANKYLRLWYAFMGFNLSLSLSLSPAFTGAVVGFRTDHTRGQWFFKSDPLQVRFSFHQNVFSLHKFQRNVNKYVLS